MKKENTYDQKKHVRVFWSTLVGSEESGGRRQLYFWGILFWEAGYSRRGLRDMQKEGRKIPSCWGRSQREGKISTLKRTYPQRTRERRWPIKDEERWNGGTDGKIREETSPPLCSHL
ncbi:hypothetical protein KP509_33G006300 [Ceratopteris richardii]|uniref:Uncharacterized protein n=1 Tax=Ceratopteris richardii TaxID=49495 RepID=A0A8T2QNM4_CERRI|nr:hypothetical protein KP509_33G006300 [Ceratopteris richardii]